MYLVLTSIIWSAVELMGAYKHDRHPGMAFRYNTLKP